MSKFGLAALKAALLSTCLFYPMAASAQQADDEEIVVTGQREALRRSIDQRRAADNFIEGLSADEAGKLPDQNVGESIRRLPGVSVANDQGEGRYVIIRGVNPSLANVTLNGQTAAAPEPDGRQVKLDDIPASLISSVQVIKSLTPDLDANAIAGTVNIETASAFDRAETFFGQARGAYGYANLNGENPYEADVTLGGRMGQFGLVVSANHSYRPIRSENLQGASTWRLINGNVVPNDWRIREYNLERERSGLVVNLDWRPSNDVSLYLRTTYAEFTDTEARDQFRFELPAAAANYANQTAYTGNIIGGGRATRFIRVRNEEDTTINLTLGGRFALGAGELRAEIGYVEAEKTDPLRSEWTFRTSSNLTGSYDLTREDYIVFPGANAYNPALFPFQQVTYDRRQAVEELWQARVDYMHPITWMGGSGELRLGFKITDRDKTNERDILVYSPAMGGFNLGVAAYMGGESIFDGRYVFGPRVGYDLAEAYIASNPNQRALNLASSTPNSLGNDYEASEQVTAAYVMATLRYGDLTVIPGVRVEHTEGEYSAKEFTNASPINMPFNVFASRSYTDWFPGVNLRYDLGQNVVLRAAVTTAIGRPNYFEVVPSISVDIGGNEVSMGNPSLSPLRSVNFDAGAEYYPNNDSIFAVGFFYKHINDPIYVSSEVLSGNFAGNALVNALVFQPRNAAEAYVGGVEITAQTQFSFLPGFWGGFGVGANFTWTTSEARGLLNRPDRVPLFQQSPTVATAQLFYERYGITGRIAYSYRSAFLDTVGANPAGDIYNDDFGQIDARIAYDVNENIQVFLEGTNLNDAEFRRYIGLRNQTVEIERYDWVARTGLQLRF